ncbi:MAG: 2-dehydro-3-deoxy-6-phosphogalactonate aldolase [Sneathiellales bacterium]|nr:2-dehydro-3-deoxy-6-phosphogalactonate aldolase [Sneathiellales bacterium]
MSSEVFSVIGKMPLVAILRGLEPGDAAKISDALVEAGFVFMEVTLNSPSWQKSLEIMKDRHGDDIVLGAGTVLHADEVDQVQAAGGQVIISPNMDPSVIQRTKELGLVSVPGCYSPTECFNALKYGADILKIFPAETLGPSFLKAIKAVLPVQSRVCPTGGITTENMQDFVDADVYAMGMGSFLFKPGKTPQEVQKAARALVDCYKNCIS